MRSVVNQIAYASGRNLNCEGNSFTLLHYAAKPSTKGTGDGNDGAENKKNLLERIVDLKFKDDDVLGRSRAILKDLECEDTRFYQATTRQRLAMGLGASNVVENGFSLLLPYGLPFIEGSMLKGAVIRELGSRLQVSAGLERIKDKNIEDTFDKTRDALGVAKGHRDSNRLKAYFEVKGSLESSGAFDCLGGWMIVAPGERILVDTPQGRRWVQNQSSNEVSPFALDVVTPHHPGYYQKGDTFPSERNNPIPSPFLAVRRGVTFVFPIRANPNLHPMLKELLKDALEKRGIGAKTSRGYGRFTDFKEYKPQ